MITGDVKNQVDHIWDSFWSGGISNPLEVIEQVHHKVEAYLDAYLAAAGITAEKGSPLWRSMPRAGGLGAPSL